ncbi:MAG: O-antigen ligase family protein [Aphanocapsa sp. GSE-SYN-MK-11-07L]|jgi:hypothetical protein|nr:O-antigen ligase family protein [Aphanocapsa sp. GSE-SYN-MK-11-07L]
MHPELTSQPSENPRSPSQQEGRLLGLLVAFFYGLFTLMPDSNSLMVSWPWVFLWQIGLTCPVLWWIWQLWYQRHWQNLGNGLDWLAALTLLGLVISPLFAEFPNQARWYSWAALGFLAALYALSAWLKSAERRRRLLVGQGYLNLAFIVWSLWLWGSQTALPELQRLAQLRQSGLNLSYNFDVLELRNWAPIGHQNYVAGYLLLALPLLVGLAVLETGKRRWLWLAGLGLGLIALYATSSRGGWLGLLALAIASLIALVIQRSRQRLWVGLIGGGGLAILIAIILTSQRSRQLWQALISGNVAGEAAYRLITNLIGWRIGQAHVWTGAGGGSVPLLFQRYRPAWAGREAELAYQLHSTPAQLWAELGIWGILPAVLLVVLLAMLGLRWLNVGRQHPEAILTSDRVLVGSIYGGLLGYGVVSLTDYQLDNICISGTLVIFLAVLAAAFRDIFGKSQVPRRSLGIHGLGWVGLGLLVAAGVWLAPIHQAWNLSSQGFLAIAGKKPNFEVFTQRLSQAHDLAPWEPYYPLQLGWNLANKSLQTADPQARQSLVDNGIIRFQQSIANSPYQEFAHSNLGWMILGPTPVEAGQSFARSAQLMAAKKGVFYGLGLSLLAQGKQAAAIEAISLEALRDPPFMTSPIWRSPDLSPLYQPVFKKLLARYGELLQQYPSGDPLNAYFHQVRGGLQWWQGNLASAQQDWQTQGSGLSQLVLKLSQNQLKKADLEGNSTPGAILLQAWLNPNQRQQLLQQAWLFATQSDLPADTEKQMLTGMAQSTSFEQWVKEKAPIREYRRLRAGFSVLSRHIDGPAPQDFLVVVENIPVEIFLPDLLPSPFYMPELDKALQPWRDALVKRVLPS